MKYKKGDEVLLTLSYKTYRCTVITPPDNDRQSALMEVHSPEFVTGKGLRTFAKHRFKLLTKLDKIL